MLRPSLAIAVAVAALLALPHAADARTKRRRKPPRLVNAVELPSIGEGYVVPATWRARGLSWGRAELVELVERAARGVARNAPGATLYVADLSYRKGGPSLWHRSHRTGRDVDLIFYALDDAGRPARAPRAMVSYGWDGVAEDGRIFDVERNWELVKTLLSDRRTRVERIFVAEHLEDLLLAHAEESGERAAFVARAATILAQPTDSQPHDDHFHVRIGGGAAVRHPSGRSARQGKMPYPRDRARVPASSRRDP